VRIKQQQQRNNNFYLNGGRGGGYGFTEVTLEAMATDWTFLKGLRQTFNAIKTKRKCAHAVFVQLNSFKTIIVTAAASGRFRPTLFRLILS
jgi:hypothetical protein